MDGSVLAASRIGGGGGAPTPAVEQVADMLHRVLYKFFDEFHADEISLQRVLEACGAEVSVLRAALQRLEDDNIILVRGSDVHRV